ncbi:signal peptidase II [Lysinimonas soli]|uniref:Lipoprotein signal peptidase n=1 Tax=Lysinimonas soli TaxID=1074233 RepID=A0ABW0NMH6_9MICO
MPQATEQAAPNSAPGRGRVSVRALLLLAAVALALYGLDQFTKYLIVSNIAPGETVPVLGEVLQLHFVTNSGAAFSLATGFTWILSIIAVGVSVVIIWFARRIRSFTWAVVFGLVLGGAVGNLTDRLFRPPGFGSGHVVDFIQVWGFPAIFNIADSALVCAVGLFIILSLRGIGLDGRKAVYVRRARSADDPDVVPEISKGTPPKSSAPTKD